MTSGQKIQQPAGASPDELRVDRDGHVTLVEIRRGPHNYVDVRFMGVLAEVFEQPDREPACRCVVLASEDRAFCAGADFNSAGAKQESDPAAFYAQAMRLFRTTKPIVAWHPSPRALPGRHRLQEAHRCRAPQSLGRIGCAGTGTRDGVLTG